MNAVGPLLCAGITMYDPLVYHGAADGKKKMTIGVIGVGGLGTMGIKYAHAMGHKVVAISTSRSKEQMARKKGADEFVVSSDPESMKNPNAKCDLILNTVSAPHQISDYLNLLNNDGTLVQLGLVTEPHKIVQLPLVFGRKSISGSKIGGIHNTEEMLKFSAKHNILPDIKVVEAKDIDNCYA